MTKCGNKIGLEALSKTFEDSLSEESVEICAIDSGLQRAASEWRSMF